MKYTWFVPGEGLILHQKYFGSVQEALEILRLYLPSYRILDKFALKSGGELWELGR